MPRNGAFRIDGTQAPGDLRPGVKWSARDYENDIARALWDIRIPETGRIVERYVAGAARRVTIAPEESARKRQSQAHGKPDGSSDVTVRFSPGFYVAGTPGYAVRLRSPWSPYAFWTPDAPQHGAPGMKVDEALFHEIFHAMRKVTGNEYESFGDELGPPQEEVLIPGYAPKVKHNAQRILFFGDREEFNAVMVANIYISEKNNERQLYGRADETYDLRRDHNKENARVPLASPGGFHSHPLIEPLIQQLVLSQHDLCEEIALVPATFNPIRDHLIRKQTEKMAFLFLRRFKNSRYRTMEFYRTTTMSLYGWLGPDKFNALYDAV